jgi:hypothetical protein
MTLNTHIKWFSGAQPTIERAQEFYTCALFNPAAVFELPDGEGYTLAYIREQDCPPRATAQRVMDLVGYKMVSYCNGLLGIWKPYLWEQENDTQALL